MIVSRWVMATAHGWDAIEGKVVMHLCDNPPCFRYDHLRIGTQRDNIHDMIAKGRDVRNTELPAVRGHLNGQSKLTETDVIEIRRLYAETPRSQREIAKMFGVDQHTVSRIVRRKNWSHI